MAFPTFVGKGTFAEGSGAISPTVHPSTIAGDLLLYFIETNDQAVSASGWTQAGSSPQGDPTAATRLTVLYRWATGSDPTTSSDSGDHQIGNILTFRDGVGSGNPFDVTAGGVDTTSDTGGDIPGATTLTGDCLVVVACSTTRDANSTTEFSGWTNANLASLTEREDLVRASGAGGGFGVATGQFAGPGDYGSTEVTLANASAKGMWSGAILPTPLSGVGHKFAGKFGGKFTGKV